MKTRPTTSVVFNTGLDGYHFAKLRQDYNDVEIINAMQQDIRDQTPTIATTQAFIQASCEFEYLKNQSVGDGRCKRVRTLLDSQTMAALATIL